MLALDQIHSALIFAALLGSGLIAGVFFTFSTFVMKALARMMPEEGIKAMQSINLTVLNPWFLGVFLGTAAICILLLVWPLLQWDLTGYGYLMAGSVLYLIGSIMVTGIFNVPKNEALAKIDVSAADSESFWRNYVDEWTSWNHIRTIASLLAVACFAVGFQNA
ncbi:MAG: DUF1772 domain-containing protein [Proteobacteria bacterium]|nr:DUF1772 domain-containing protein [Pseudomonadota bacterium]